MTRFIDDAERRARLGRRHALAAEERTSSVVEATQSVVAVHGTDPASTFLAILARAPDLTIADIERALYETRSIVRVLGLRRTIFAVDYRLAPSIWSASESTVARNERNILERLLRESGISEDIPAWIRAAETRLLEIIASNPGATSSQLAKEDALLGHRVDVGGNSPYAAKVTVASRLLTLLSAEGRVVRGRPLGGWTSTQFTWSATDDWRQDWAAPPLSANDADRTIAHLWLSRYGPGRVEDLQWWAGWPKGRTRKAIEAAGGVEVELEEGSGWVLDSDLEPVAPPEPWVALLPGLDPTTMGWKERSFYLGTHAAQVFDQTGNGGPTAWVDGRIVGGWTQLDSGEVAFDLLEDVGSEAMQAIEARAAELQARIAGVRLKPRARQWSRIERALNDRHTT